MGFPTQMTCVMAESHWSFWVTSIAKGRNVIITSGAPQQYYPISVSILYLELPFMPAVRTSIRILYKSDINKCSVRGEYKIWILKNFVSSVLHFHLAVERFTMCSIISA